MRRFMWFSVLLSALTVATSVSAQDIRRALFIATLSVALLAAEATTPAWSKMGRSYGGGGGSIASPDFGSTAGSTPYYIAPWVPTEFQMKFVTSAIIFVMVVDVVAESFKAFIATYGGPYGRITVTVIGLAESTAEIGILWLLGYEDEAIKKFEETALIIAAMQATAGSPIPGGNYVSLTLTVNALREELEELK